MTVAELLQYANVLVVPAFGYIVVLERRITRMQTQIEQLLMRGRHHG
jgi:hypothetical protein